MTIMQKRKKKLRLKEKFHQKVSNIHGTHDFYEVV